MLFLSLRLAIAFSIVYSWPKTSFRPPSEGLIFLNLKEYIYCFVIKIRQLTKLPEDDPRMIVLGEVSPDESSAGLKNYVSCNQRVATC